MYNFNERFIHLIFSLLYDLNKRFMKDFRIKHVISFALRLNDARRRGISSRLRCLIRHGLIHPLNDYRLMNTTTIRESTTRRSDDR